MQVQIRQGIIQHPTALGGQSFLQLTSGGNISLRTANGPTFVAFAHGGSDYLLTEDLDVVNAWTNVPANRYLYWDIDRLTAVRTFGTAAQAVLVQASAPFGPVEGQHWFDLTRSKMYVFQSGNWLDVIRVFAAFYNGAVILSPFGSGSFTGSQVGYVGSFSIGRILLQNDGKPIRKTNGQFITTETDFFVQGAQSSSLRLDSETTTIKFFQPAAPYSIVALSQDGAGVASYNDIGTAVLAITQEGRIQNDIGSVIVQGTIRNPDWDWSTVSAPLWIDDVGALTDTDLGVTASTQHPVRRAPIARVVDANTIIFQPLLGTSGDRGPAGSVYSTFSGEWNNTFPFPTGSVVQFEGSLYLATNDSTNSTPQIDNVNPNWQLLVRRGFGAGETETVPDGVLNHVVTGTTDPINAPEFIGQHYINTVSGEQFLANGTASVLNWVSTLIEDVVISANVLNHVLSGATAPSIAPAYIGQHYINTVNGDHYLANGTASVNNWALVGGGFYHGYVGGDQNAPFADTNTAYGTGALSLSETPSGPDDDYTSIYNTAFGNNALKSADLSFESTAVGYGALENGVDDLYSDAFGAFALYSNTFGSGNTALGNYAMYGNTTGYSNTAVGGGALSSNTVGNNNTAVGRTAGSGSTGSENTFVGRYAGAVSGGSFNVALGASALYATSGANSGRNIAIGYSAYGSAFDGRDSVAIGHRAALSIPTWDEIAIGSESLANNSNVYTGNGPGNNIAIGKRALYNFAGPDRQNIAIGNYSQQNNTLDAYYNVSIGVNSLTNNISGAFNVVVGRSSLQSNVSGSANVAVGDETLYLNTTGTGNVSLGYIALRSNTTGVNNVAVGNSALRFNTTGSETVAVGVSALYSNTSGVANTAVGSYALTSNITGSSNSAVGYGAMTNNTAGSFNTAFGHDCMYSSGGSDNVAVGHTAMYSNQFGGGNTVIGRAALYANTSGNFNTASGRSSLTANTTGNNNTATGYQSLRRNTTGSSNSAFGYRSLDNNSQGNFNVAVGEFALGANDSGNSNTAVGFNALFNNTTGFGNISFGSFALNGNTSGFSNSAFGINALQSNTVGNSNTAIGAAALASNTTGTSSTAIGSGALQAATGSNNFAIGTSSGNDAVRTITTASNEGVLGNNSTLAIYSRVPLSISSDTRDNAAAGTTVPHGLSFLQSVTPIKYQFATVRGGSTPTGRVRYGFDAAQIAALQADVAIVDTSDSVNLKFNGNDMMAVMVNAIKDLASRSIQSIPIACSDETTALTTGTAKVTFRMPYGFTLTAVRASVTTAPTGSTLIVDIKEAGVSILGTKLSINAGAKTSTTATSQATITDASLADDSEITIDITQIGSTIAGAGLKVYLIGTKI